MKISAELFLLDNMLMDLLVLRLAAVLTGKRLRSYAALPVALLGAVYALLSMTVAPVLRSLPLKLLAGALMALTLTDGFRGYLRCLLALYLSAFLLGGLMLSLSILFGGELSGGALIGTVPLRVMLLTAAVCAALPRLVRALLAVYRGRSRHVRLRIDLPDRALLLRALVDSGNLLTEPVSGLPVVVIREGVLPRAAGRPVPYASLGSEGWLQAIRPHRICAYLDEWVEIDAYVAEAVGGLGAEEAVIAADLLRSERRVFIDQTLEDAAWEPVQEDAPAVQKGTDVHPFGGNATDAVPSGGGDDMDRAAHAGR